MDLHDLGRVLIDAAGVNFTTKLQRVGAPQSNLAQGGVTMPDCVTPPKYEKYNRGGVWSFSYADDYGQATRVQATRTTAVTRDPR